MILHFKTRSPGIIQTAFTGDQSGLNVKEMSNTYVHLKSPVHFKDFRNPITMLQKDSIDFVGKDVNGGFSSTVFGSRAYNAFWTVIGDTPAAAIYECGGRHSLNDNDVKTDAPSSIATHHSVWFRGSPPSKDLVVNRLISRLGRSNIFNKK